jgi:hypothetical protein
MKYAYVDFRAIFFTFVLYLVLNMMYSLFLHAQINKLANVGLVNTLLAGRERKKKREKKSRKQEIKSKTSNSNLNECLSRGILELTLNRIVTSSIRINQIARSSVGYINQSLSSAIKWLGEGPGDAGRISLALSTAFSRVSSARAVARTDTAQLGCNTTATHHFLGGRVGAEVGGTGRGGGWRGREAFRWFRSRRCGNGRRRGWG